MSELGVQQGETLAPLLFFVVLHSLVLLIEDDGTLVGDIGLIVRALGIIEEFGPRLGAHLNHEKS